MASAHTVSTLPRISNNELSQILLSHTSSNVDAVKEPPNVAIVDVRDDDHIGGHIRHSIHAPSHTLDHKIPELVRKLADKEIVVFHCALSQQRGPSAALRYLRERERLIPSSKPSSSTSKSVHDLLPSAPRRTRSQTKEAESEKDAGWEDMEDGGGEGKESEGQGMKEQEVYVLKGGFVEWQERFGEDSRLTEGYEKTLWKYGYWG